jgi:hypothetical protein
MNRFVTYFKVWSAALMLVAGVALSVAGFAVSPVGEIHDSVLWYFAQCLIYAGSAVGIDVIIDKRVCQNVVSGEKGFQTIQFWLFLFDE